MQDQRLKTRVENFITRLEHQEVCMHGFILSVAGEIKAKAYYAPLKEGRPHRMYSISKTMTALAIGILIDEGKLALDDHIADYFEDYLPPDPDDRLLRLTIRDMLRMATCHCSTAYRECVDENWTRPFFTVSSTQEPGTVFNYDTGCSQVLASLVTRLSGYEVIDFLNERVFKPIGATDEKYWLRDPSGACQGGTGLCMSLRDLHKVTRLIMEGGRGIIPDWFCDEMVRKHIDTGRRPNAEECYGYGWQLWITRSGWAMYGLGGQLAVVCPEKDVCLCTIADTRLDKHGVQHIYDAFFEEIYPYIGMEDMNSAEWQLPLLPIRNTVEYAVDAVGPFYFAHSNHLGLRSVELRESSLVWETVRGKHEVQFRVGENVNSVFPGWSMFETVNSGGWIAPGVLRLRCFITDDAPWGLDVLLRFHEKKVIVESRRMLESKMLPFEGNSVSTQNQQETRDKMITIFWAGDSTVKQNSIVTYPQTGIGQMFHRYVRNMQVQIENYAENGRSTKSFIDEGRLAIIYDRIKAGDYLFIQFGHNDEKPEDPARYANPEVEFPANLERFVNVARNKGATPVFITPLTRWDRSNPNAKYRHDEWAAIYRWTAERLNVALIDLTRMSEELVDALGDQARTDFFMNIPAGKYPAYPNGLKDGTHLQPMGAMTFAGLIARGLYELGGQYRDLLCDGYAQWLQMDERLIHSIQQEGADERQ